MPSDIVFSAIEDNRRHLWLVTENGLSKFDPFAEVFDNYPLKIQLSDVQFNEGVAVKNINGEIIINTNKGLCHFFQILSQRVCIFLVLFFQFIYWWRIFTAGRRRFTFNS